MPSAVQREWRGDAPLAEAERALESFQPGLPLAAITVFYVNPAKEREFVEQGLFLTASTSRLPGVNAFQFHRGCAAQPDCVEYMLYEAWNSRELFHAQCQSRHVQRFADVIRELTVAPPTRTFYLGWCDSTGTQQE